MVTVIIAAYKAELFIEDCLKSIEIQTHRNIRVLLGVDGCEATLEVVKGLRDKYKMEVWYGPNQGPYGVKNFLLSQANIQSEEYFLTFDADDKMQPNMVELLVKKECNQYVYFEGVQYLRKADFDKVGSYQPWRCAADTDVITRLRKAGINITQTQLMFMRRQHPGQLTKMAATSFNSEYRNQRVIDIETSPIWIEPQMMNMQKV